jgi:flagellar biosynthesis anti-sigma factor FlgM
LLSLLGVLIFGLKENKEVVRMKIGDIFKRTNVAPEAAPAGKADAANVQDQAARGAGSLSDDRVTISPEAREYARISRIVDEDEAARKARVDEIKSRVNSGDYQVSSDAVARAILSYSQQQNSE